MHIPDLNLALTEDNPTIKPYDQDAWALLPDTKNLPINISLTLLHALHTRWYELMNDMSENQWERTVYHPERKKTITLWDLLKGLFLAQSSSYCTYCETSGTDELELITLFINTNYKTRFTRMSFL